MYSVYENPRYFKFKWKYQQYKRTMFQGYFSISYVYGARNLDEYFHFYGIAGQKYKMKEIIVSSCFVSKKIAVSVL